MRLVNEFMEGRTRLDRSNYSQMMLIPKDQTPTTVNEFRPIALLNSSLKIMSKILANRLSPLLENLNGDYQLGFIKGRNILEGVAQAHEVIHHTKRTQQDTYMLKLDFEKAYDMIDWDCLMEAL